MTTRNQVFDALLALAPGTIGGATFSTRSRKFQHFTKVEKAFWPVLFQVEPTELVEQLTKLPYKRRWYAQWWIYIASNESDPEDKPALAMNDYIDGVEKLFTDIEDQDPNGLVTLGGLCHHVFIDGEMLKVPGDDNGEGILMIPITILMP